MTANYSSSPIIASYSGQGIHRTGTDVDEESGQWLAQLVRDRGAEPMIESFPFERLDVLNASLEIGGSVIDGVPLFDCLGTGPDGITGRLSLSRQPGAILLARAEPTLKSANTRRALRIRHHPDPAGILLVTDDREVPPGLALINAWDYEQPFGPPCLQVTSNAFPFLEDACRSGAIARLVVSTDRTPVEAFNVGGILRGSDSTLSPLVVMTPRSGWWGCASERGAGIAVWLDIVEALAVAGAPRTVLFTANTGHELGYLGIHRYMEVNPGLGREAHAWIHLGADVASVDAEVTVQYSNRAIGDRIETLAARHGAQIDHRVSGEVRPVGEVRGVFECGGRYASILGPGPWFHHQRDLWPHVIDQGKAAAWSRVFVDLALWLAAD